MDQVKGREPVVVLVEDSDEDVALFTRAARRVDPALLVRTARSAGEAAATIKRSRRVDLRLVVIDFTLEDGSAMPLLAQLRTPSNLLRVPVVIFTGSASEGEIDLALQVGANSVVIKPTDPSEFERAVEAMVRYWLSKNLVPLKE